MAAEQSGPRTALSEVSVAGEFKRTPAGFRNAIEEGGRFEPEAGRYHLYISYACPWANRCLAVMYLKGLEDVIGLSVVHPTWQRTRPDQDAHTGWAFRAPTDPPVSGPTGFGSFDCEGCIPDTVNDAKFVRDLYDLAKDTTGKYSVPVLWDKKLGTIVNNESSEIVRLFNSKFNHLAKNPTVDIAPQELLSEIEELAKFVYPGINNGVYRCGFATSQQAYDAAFAELNSALDRVEAILDKSRFLTGDRLTEADIFLFMTLIRFDEVYVVYFKTNRRPIREYPNLREYVKDLYQVPAIGRSISIKHIKTHYFTSHPLLNHYAIIPGGSAPYWEQPHNRAERFGGPYSAL